MVTGNLTNDDGAGNLTNDDVNLLGFETHALLFHGRYFAYEKVFARQRPIKVVYFTLRPGMSFQVKSIWRFVADTDWPVQRDLLTLA